MNSKSDELDIIREDIEAVKSAVGLLRDWIANKFGVQVFDKNLLQRTHQNFNESAIILKDNRTVMPTITKPITYPTEIVQMMSSYELPEISFGHPIQIIHHQVNCVDEIQYRKSEDINQEHKVQEAIANPGCSSTMKNLTSTPSKVSLESQNSSVSEIPSTNDDGSAESSQRKNRKTKSKPVKQSKLPENLIEIQCEICGKILNGNAAMKRHMQTHKNFRSHICTDCGKCFQRSFHLKTHRMIHTGEKKHQCRFCGKLFLLPKDLICHERTHTNEKPFECTECSRRFNLKSHLTMHFRTHTGEKPYKCNVDQCDKSFSQSNSLRVHKKTHQKPKEDTSRQIEFELQLINSANNIPSENVHDHQQEQILNQGDKTPIITVIESVPNTNLSNVGQPFANYEETEPNTNDNAFFVFQS